MIHMRLALSFFFFPLAALLISGCSPKIEDTPAYQQACEGSPLRTIERRSQAVEEGYEIHPHYDCISKESYIAVREQQARWAAANTPEALAKRAAEREQLRFEEQRQASLDAERLQSDRAAFAPRFVLRPVDVNSASVAELASVATVGDGAAEQIVSQRQVRPFDDWADLVGRVVEMSAAQTVFSASTCGLTVNGLSMPGAPMAPPEAASLCAR